MRIVIGLLMVWAMVSMSGKVVAVDIVGHRGASHDAPENTLASYRLAWRQNADAIEGDFRYTRDGQIVCMHDATTQRTAAMKAKVAELTFEQLRKLDAGLWKDARFKGEPIPTLKEILAIVPKGKRLFLEVKAGPEILPDIRRQIEESGLAPSQVVIIAFDEKVIAAAKQLMPAIKANWLYEFKKKDGKWSADADELVKRLGQMKADGLSVGFSAVSQEVVNQQLADKLSQAKLQLHVWTVDDVGLARRAVELGAVSITTNRPAWLREELGK